ncbi:hypothetical protein [Ensifer adhaerens]|uniref:hypothetical protein n=1 Tax=Ensifer adhaerens TaxID=106592 RepID=UPI001177591E|nr:hypothetical protein [Ensifer adhaerens]
MDEEVDHDWTDPLGAPPSRRAARRSISKPGMRTPAARTFWSATFSSAFCPSSMRIVRLQHEIMMGRIDPNHEHCRILKVSAVCALAKRRLTTALTDTALEIFLRLPPPFPELSSRRRLFLDVPRWRKCYWSVTSSHVIDP